MLLPIALTVLISTIIPNPVNCYKENSGPQGSEFFVPAADNALIYGTQLHNTCRTKHHAPDLVLDLTLSGEAQDYADLVTSQNLTLQPQGNSLYGQNVYEVRGYGIDVNEAVGRAVANWYNGVSDYNWNEPLRSGPFGNLFSQVVWKSSKFLGLGISSQSGRTIVVAFYSPPGNIFRTESYRENVLPA